MRKYSLRGEKEEEKEEKRGEERRLVRIGIRLRTERELIKREMRSVL
jgi:hypothetical protein